MPVVTVQCRLVLLDGKKHVTVFAALVDDTLGLSGKNGLRRHKGFIMRFVVVVVVS